MFIPMLHNNCITQHYKILQYYFLQVWDIKVGIVAGYGLDNQSQIFHFSTASRPVLRPTQPAAQ
jgi:hypothetical protein